MQAIDPRGQKLYNFFVERLQEIQTHLSFINNYANKKNLDSLSKLTIELLIDDIIKCKELLESKKYQIINSNGKNEAHIDVIHNHIIKWPDVVKIRLIDEKHPFMSNNLDKIILSIIDLSSSMKNFKDDCLKAQFMIYGENEIEVVKPPQKVQDSNVFIKVMSFTAVIFIVCAILRAI